MNVRAPECVQPPCTLTETGHDSWPLSVAKLIRMTDDVIRLAASAPYLAGTTMTTSRKIMGVAVIPALAITFVVGALAVGAVPAQERIPEHASMTARGSWICDSGYAKRQQSCVPLADASDAEVRQQMVDESIASYSGNCPCPYNVDRAGRSCGRRSAYSRPGGASPLCYVGDITDEAVTAYRKLNTR